ncbi:MAG: helix-turn-helix domain-containing protein [Anaerolineaceae bacterium]|nr:helix-turn-helix domain-containing protein [Anaerolineaceae bacterium]
MPQYQIWNLRTREKRVIETEHSHLAREQTGWPAVDTYILPVELGKITPKNEELWGIKDLCNFFGISKTTAYGLLQDGTIPAYKDKRFYRIKAMDALDWFINCDNMENLDAVLLSRMYRELPVDKKKQLMDFAKELSS